MMDTGKIYYDSNDNECSIWQMVRREPEWAAARIQEGEKAIEELTRLRAENEGLKEDIKLGREREVILDKMQHKANKELAEAKRGWISVELTEFQINDACMWYRHDFGLMDEEKKEHFRFCAKEWFRALGKALQPPAPEGDER